MACIWWCLTQRKSVRVREDEVGMTSRAVAWSAEVCDGWRLRIIVTHDR
jgi:hypothetical protein